MMVNLRAKKYSIIYQNIIIHFYDVVSSSYINDTV
ncbi:MAG: hypothetical protein ACD_46C00582G0002 [uncultured bacterium]|nr:MAG: hypothetical protein ACD_46C00582G0002 [uncultured bacterium]